MSTPNRGEEARPLMDDDDVLFQQPDGGNLTPDVASLANESDDDVFHEATEGLSHDLERQGPRGVSLRDRTLRLFNRWVPIQTTYERLNNGITTGRMQANRPGRFIGLGTDGVFRNLMAKPELEAESNQREVNPPTYEEAAADSSPEYWELTVISPIYEDEVFVNGLPVGNIANFVWNILVLVAFQFVGFVLCYLLHTSHAAKDGARTGLGVTFIMYGWKRIPLNRGSAATLPPRVWAANPYQYEDVWKGANLEGIRDSFVLALGNSTAVPESDDDWTVNQAPYLAYGLIAFGLFIILNALIDYYRVKMTERSILAPLQPVLTTITEEVSNDPNE